MQLTPWVLTSATLLVMLVVPPLTFAISAWLLGRYRRAVTRHMQGAGGDASDGSKAPCAVAPQQGPARVADTSPGTDPMRGPHRLLRRYAIAGAAFAAVFAAAAWFVYPHQLGVPGYLLAWWIYLWPVAVAAWLVLPVDWSRRLGLLALYAAVFAGLIAWAHTIKDIPAIRSGTIALPARSSATPQVLLRLWLAVSGAPTVLAMLCFNRWARPVAPLVLAFVTVVVIGLLGVYLTVFSPRGIDVTVAAAVALDVHVFWLLGAMLIITIALLGAGAWFLLRWFTRASRRRTVVAQSLMLDALWLLFASFFGMWLVLGGVGWIAVAPLGFVVYKLALLATRPGHEAQTTGRGLTFLRVFDSDRRSERLFDRLNRYWRHIGSLQLITGRDTAGSTVKPHQFLDFVGGKLATHFIRDDESLERSVAACDRTRDSDGLFRVNSFFCRDDTWKRALPRMFGEGDRVLMDLRGFSATNAGCRHEIEFLVSNVPVERCLLLVDETTDQDYLAGAIERAFDTMFAGSPNQSRTPDALALHEFAAGAGAERALVRRLSADANPFLADRATAAMPGR